MDERIIRYFDGELTENERILLLKELKTNPELKGDMLHYQNMKAFFSLSPENINTESGVERYQSLMKIQQKRKVVTIVKTTMSYAAIFCLIVITTWMIAKSGDIQDQASQTASMQELFVPAGQRAKLTLPDGSVVWLNAGSTLSYPSFFGEERKVKLTGEAYFDVAANPDKPFIVSTELMDIKALGTEFNVYSYSKAEYTSTSLINGSVKVYQPAKEKEGITLAPNQQLFFENGQFRVETVDNDDLLWRDGIYSFKKERLNVIVKKLELYYDVDIVVKNPQILQYEYSGKFRQRDGIMEILQIIQKIHKFKIEKDEDLNQIRIT
ncbi:MAG: FecR domain-containing protein [Tannerella sp.]|jgi:ferric-dicitrate binding protein FerR (iron transport regulator)|nr:FecR domain-containing protein [Tannerella sp.]